MRRDSSQDYLPAQEATEVAITQQNRKPRSKPQFSFLQNCRLSPALIIKESSFPIGS